MPHLLKLLGTVGKPTIPFLAKTTDERIFEKLPQREFKFSALLTGTFAYTPLVIIKTYKSIAEICHTDRVKSTTYRLAPISLSRPKRLLRSTETAILHNTWFFLSAYVKVIVISKHAILASYDACDEIAFLISIGNPLFVYDSLCLST